MLKKFGIYFLSFILIGIVNVALLYKLSAKNRRTQYVQHLLTEIDHPVPQTQFGNSSAPLVLGAYTPEFKTSDGRAANLMAFFRKYNSPLYDYADVMVREADANGFDYRLLAAIAMQESTLCKFIPENSYNCWGWGIYGDTVTRFSSYEEAIKTISAGIKEEYIDKGLVTASTIMRKYTPPSQGSWAHGVNTVLNWLDE